MHEVEDIEPGIQRIILDTKELYPNREEHNRFEERLSEFLALDIISEIMDYYNGVLSYLTESVIPTKQDLRPPLLLLFGNPAPNSILNKCFFAGKTGKKEYRFWQKLKEASIVSFDYTDEDANAFRTKALFKLNYSSSFRVGLTVFHSIPSPASGKKWSGVDGLRTLFGARVLKIIAESETQRVESQMQEFIGNNSRGAVIVFQKDAYLGVKDYDSQESLVAKEGKQCVVKTRCSCSDVMLFRMPPTRYILAPWYVKLLQQVRDHILGEG